MTELNASRGLDALVAEKVMGWVRVVDEPRLIGEWYRPPDYPMTAATCEVPRYSTDIGAAWSVVEKMRHKFSFRMDDNLGLLPWYASFTDFSPELRDYKAEGHTVPEAICKAALAAVGAQRGEK